LWCPDSKKVIQSRDVTFNENAMLSYGNESVISSTGIGDQEDASRTMEIEVKNGAELLIIQSMKFLKVPSLQLILNLSPTQVHLIGS